MRLKTMNKKINQARLDMSMILTEFKIKLDTHLRGKIKYSCYTEVKCNKVVIKSDGFLTGDELEAVQYKFFLELDTFEEVYSPSSNLLYVLYNFKHTKQV